MFIDDSADQHKKKYVVAGAIIGRKGDWSAFNKEWRKALNRQPAISHFHGKELRRLSGPFRQFQNAIAWPPPSGSIAANAKRDDLRKVIDTSGLIAFGVGVSIPVYERIRNSHARGKTFLAKDAFEYILQALIYEVTRAIREVDKNVKVAFISDDSNRAEKYTSVYAEWKKWNPTTAKSMLELTHSDDKEWYGLQAADMAASTVKACYEEHDETGNVPHRFPLFPRFWRITIISETYILDMLDHQSPRDSEFTRAWQAPRKTNAPK